ncbi:MAG: tRNA pseudouridine(38-40) synthase TruA [Chlamydiota bacterium]|jgi:tRNA pseudouridine38-40 synthase
MKQRYKILFSYDGTHYHGWQIQPNGITIQQTMQEIFSQILQENIHLTASGRTDANAHAFQQVAHFDVASPLNLDKFLHSANLVLPHDIKVLFIEPVSSSFHARYSTKDKIYHYYIYNDSILPPFLRNYRLHVPQKLDIELMKQAVKKFEGIHDFTSFSNRGSNDNERVKNITSAFVTQRNNEVIVHLRADGFLYKMVRNIVGCLLQVATHKLSIQAIEDIFAAKDRRSAPSTVPANGLFLMEVLYPSTSALSSNTSKKEKLLKLLQEDKFPELLPI